MAASEKLSLKRKCTCDETNYNKCVISQAVKKGINLQNVTELGYNSFLYALENRNDDVSQRLYEAVKEKDNFFANQPQWHADCRNRYNNSKTVKQKKKQRISDPLSASGSEMMHDKNLKISTRSTMSVPKDAEMKYVCCVIGEGTGKCVY